MAGEQNITFVGNAVRDPELRFTPNGAAVVNLTLAATPRKFNKQTNEWDDGDTVFMDVFAWQSLAENTAESIQKGMRVVAVGSLIQESWEDKETGKKQSKIKLRAEEIAPSVRFATARVTKADRPQQGGQQQQGQWGQGQGQQQGGWGQQGQQPPPQWGQQGGQQQPAGDPWATNPPQQQGAPSYDQPPPF